MTADSGGFSPSAAKPAAAVDSWQRLGLPLEIRTFEPATRAQFHAAHDKDRIDGVLDATLPNGHGNFSPELAASLPYTCGQPARGCP